MTCDCSAPSQAAASLAHSGSTGVTDAAMGSAMERMSCDSSASDSEDSDGSDCRCDDSEWTASSRKPNERAKSRSVSCSSPESAEAVAGADVRVNRCEQRAGGGSLLRLSLSALPLHADVGELEGERLIGRVCAGRTGCRRPPARPACCRQSAACSRRSSCCRDGDGCPSPARPHWARPRCAARP